VLRLATLAESAGLDGVVCSPLEAAAIREQAGQDFLLVTPGVRPASASLDDQKRVMTPAEAMAAGSSCLVIGRPVTAAPDPLQALKDINASL
ncbi:orotidine 5'-phosphate decarboxylase / HUMPS family protein, partial [Thiolapillus sp.]